MPFSLCPAPIHHSFTFSLRFLYGMKHKVRLSKTVYGIFHFRFCFFFIKVYIFVQQNARLLGFLTLWLFFKIKIIEKPHSFAPRPLIFKLQQEVLRFNAIIVSWSSTKTELVTNFFKLKNQSFENVSFSQ